MGEVCVDLVVHTILRLLVVATSDPSLPNSRRSPSQMWGGSRRLRLNGIVSARRTPVRVIRGVFRCTLSRNGLPSPGRDREAESRGTGLGRQTANCCSGAAAEFGQAQGPTVVRGSTP